MQTRENSEEPPEKITPGSPFDDPRADAIIRSSDNVDFKVHKLILSMASPVFSDMFLFPQMVQEDAELPVVTVSEGSPVMDWVLRATYPTASTELNELDFIYQIVQAADKYQMDFLVDRLMSPLGKFVESDPLRVFAVACRFKHVSLARRAAHYTLRLLQRDIIQAYIPEFKFMPSDMLQYLLRYHEQCSNAAVALTKEFTWVREYSACWWQCRNGKPGPTQCKPCEAKAVVIPGTENVWQSAQSVLL
ncbi:unnamed protein product [Somion occarium]|uniref:BTB domain-containing protein n=1 Tax=Somion occarium TaxID=3059160 RepID=A0ABP1DFZ5_9APHY